MDFLKSNTVKLFMVAIVVLVIVIIAITLISKIGKTGSADEQALISAAKKYFNSSPVILPKSNYESATVTLSTLISTGNIKSPKDKSCFSYVTVVKSGDEYIYSPYVKCNDKNDTKILKDKITSSVATSGDGVYNINNEYIYKGEDPNNYVSFSDELWRIIKIDKDGIIKIMYDGEYELYGVWDNRYNLNTENNSGINDYKVSRVDSSLKAYLDDDASFTNADRSKLAIVNLCVGKRSKTDTTVDGTAECSNVLENQMIGLLQANEYFNASNDANCSPTKAEVCQNYNFLVKPNYWTMTGVADNTSEVYTVYPREGLRVSEASENINFYPVLYLKSDTAITGGTGTKADPYVTR